MKKTIYAPVEIDTDDDEPLYCNESCEWLDFEDQSCKIFHSGLKFEGRPPRHSIFIQRCRQCRAADKLKTIEVPVPEEEVVKLLPPFPKHRDKKSLDKLVEVLSKETVLAIPVEQKVRKETKKKMDLIKAANKRTAKSKLQFDSTIR